AAAQGRRPVHEHLDEFIAAMAHAGRNAQHVAQTRTYITRVLTLAGVGRLADLAPSAVTTALGRLRDQGFSARSLAAHVVAAKAFSRWAWRDGRAADYALAGVATPSAAGD